MLKYKANVNARNCNQWTPLHSACDNGHLELTQLLLTHKADVNAHDDGKSTPLHSACSINGHLEIAELLLKYKANVNALNIEKSTPLHIACSNSHLETATSLLSNGALQLKNKNGKLPSDWATNPEIKELLRRHAVWTEFLKTRNHITNPENTEPPLWDLPGECLENIWYYMTEPNKLDCI